MSCNIEKSWTLLQTKPKLTRPPSIVKAGRDPALPSAQRFNRGKHYPRLEQILCISDLTLYGEQGDYHLVMTEVLAPEQMLAPNSEALTHQKRPAGVQSPL